MSPGPEAREVGALERNVDVLRSGLRMIGERLPAGWESRTTRDGALGAGRADAVLEISAPDGSVGRFVVEAKRSSVASDLPSMIEQARAAGRGVAGPAQPLLVFRYLGAAARSWLEERNLSYVDATGNLHVVLDRPALFVHDRGADRDPWRGPGRPLGSLQGPPAARLVRGLVDFADDATVPELAARSGTSIGTAYRVVDLLAKEDLMRRQPRGRISEVRWRALLERWSGDYGFQRSNAVSGFLEPRGVDAARAALAKATDLRYAVTGSLAAHQFAPYAPVRLLMLYADEPDELVARLRLRRVDGGANVLIGSGEFDVVYDRAVLNDGVRYVAPGQAAVDLLSGPGRSASEAGALLDWMESHEPDWRR